MAASNGIITGGNGATLSVYLPTAATVGTYLPISKSQLALVTDSVEFTPKINSLAKRISVIAGVTGVVQVEEDGSMLPYIINLAEHKVDLTIPGGTDINVPLYANRKYRLKVLVQLSA